MFAVRPASPWSLPAPLPVTMLMPDGRSETTMPSLGVDEVFRAEVYARSRQEAQVEMNAVHEAFVSGKS